MHASVTKLDDMIRLQGLEVLVSRSSYPDRVFTIRRLMDESNGGHGQLFLVHRRRGRKSVIWPLSQEYVNCMQPHSQHETAKWYLALS